MNTQPILTAHLDPGSHDSVPKSSHGVWVVVAVFLLLVLVACVPEGTPTPTLEPTAVPGPFGDDFELGGQVFGFRFAEEMHDAGMIWIKRQVVWGQGDSALDALSFIIDAHNRGFKILLSIKGRPEELRPNPDQYYENFANFLGAVAAGGPDAIEVWNEQNIDREWPSGLIDPAGYTAMLSAAFSAIKSRNSDVLVISGAPAPTGFFGGACTPANCDDRPFLEGMAAAGAADVMDCVGIHYNEGVLSPDARSGDPRGNPLHYTRYYPTMVETYLKSFPTKPLCFTELGYLSPEGYDSLPPGFEWAADISVADQAAWLARAATLSHEGGWVRLLIIWNVDSTVYGADPQAGYAIVRPDNSCPACDSLRAVMEPPHLRA